MDVERLLQRMEAEPDLLGTVQAVHERPAREAESLPLPDELPAALRGVLERRGIRRLYSHQHRAWRLARAGRNVVVATPTASGKSLCFTLPVFEELLENPSARALFLYPTKALSRDQQAALHGWIDEASLPVTAHVYDGDTPPHLRRALREEGTLVLTNPYMLHAGILPHHSKWADLFSGLRYVVVDEMHTLRGVFGSHVANVFRRLRRIAQHYGSDPIFLFASATIGNPGELARTLCGEAVDVVDEDGSPQGRRVFCFAQPPVVHRAWGIRRSAVDHAVHLGKVLLESGHHSIFFERSRNGVEVLLKYLREVAVQLGIPASAVRGYRGGYLPDLRREIEEGLRRGEVRCVVSTNALELGVDIGSLDAAVLVGYPGSVAATFQRSGRAGRRQESSATFLVGRSIATDQYLIAHPDHLFENVPETAALDPDNLVIRGRQLQCAAFELPFTVGEEFGGGGDTGELLDYMVEDARVLAKVGARYHWADRAFPADEVSLHTGDVDNFVVLDADHKTPIGEVDRPSAMTQIHPEAIYNLQGDQYYIESMDYAGRRAFARRVDVDYYTQAEIEAEVRVLEEHHSRELSAGTRVHFGELEVRKLATMYKKVRFWTRENIGAGDIALPPEELDTEGLALVFGEELLLRCQLVGPRRGAALRAFADLLEHVVPLWVRCDPGDVGCTAETRSGHFQAPTVYLWDEVPGGVGLAEAAVEHMEPVLRAMLEVARACPCDNGCPACVGASLAEGKREKEGVVELLAVMVEDAGRRHREAAS